MDKNIIQSYIFSRIRSRMSVTEMRLLMRVVEFAQCELQGLIIAKNMGPTGHNLVGKVVEIPMAAVLPDGSHHYERALEAAKSLMTKIVEHYEPTSGMWKAASFVSAAESQSGEGLIKLYIHPWVWDCILDFTKGFVKYDLGAAMRLNSPYAMKLFFLVSNQRQPISYSFNELERLFGTAGKYVRRNDFVRKVLLPAKAELDANAPWSCDLRPMKDGRRLEYCMIYPFEQRDKYSEGIVERGEHAKAPTVWAYHQVYAYLRYNVDFSPVELGRNKALIHEFAENCPRAVEMIADMNYRAKLRKDPPGKGWFVAAMKAELAKAKQDKKDDFALRKQEQLSKILKEKEK